MEEGKTFDEALKELYINFGTIVGLKKMQKQRKTEYERKLQKEQKKIAKKVFIDTFYSYFQFPKVIILGGLIILSMFLTNYPREDIFNVFRILHIVFVLIIIFNKFQEKSKGGNFLIFNYIGLLYIISAILNPKFFKNLESNLILLSVIYLFLIFANIFISEILYNHFRNKRRLWQEIPQK
jgi:hypothetical protein